MAPKQAPGGRPHSGEGSVTHRRQPLKSQKSQNLYPKAGRRSQPPSNLHPDGGDFRARNDVRRQRGRERDNGCLGRRGSGERSAPLTAVKQRNSGRPRTEPHDLSRRPAGQGGSQQSLRWCEPPVTSPAPSDTSGPVRAAPGAAPLLRPVGAAFPGTLPPRALLFPAILPHPNRRRPLPNNVLADQFPSCAARPRLRFAG